MDIVIKNFWTYPVDTTTQKDIVVLFAKPDGSEGYAIRQQTKEDLFKINPSMSLAFNPGGNYTPIVFDTVSNARLTFDSVIGLLEFIGMSIVKFDSNTKIQFEETSGEIINYDALADVKLNYLAGPKFLWYENLGSLIMSSNFASADLEMKNADSLVSLIMGGLNADTGQKVGRVLLKDANNNAMDLRSNLTELDEDVFAYLPSPRNDYDPISDDPLNLAYREDDQFRFTDNPSNADVITAQSGRHSVQVVRIVAPIANLTLDLPAAKNGDVVDFSVFGGPTTSITMTAAGGASIDSALTGTSSRHIRTWIYDDGLNAWFRFSS
jgi:hypothetical protein